MEEIADDEFMTFILPKDTKEQSLDLQQMMLAVVKGHNFTVREFWEMPLNLVLELLGMFVSPKKKPMSRKVLVDQERRWNMLNA